MTGKPCAFCRLVWDLYLEAREEGTTRDMDLPNTREYVRRHVRIEHNVILKSREEVFEQDQAFSV